MKSSTMSQDQNQFAGKTNRRQDAHDLSGENGTTQRNRSGNSTNSDSASTMKNAVQAIIHEIRNPLTAISLANQSLNEEVEYVAPTLQTLTEIISRNITRIEIILKELMHANDGEEWQFASTDLCDLIEKSLQYAGDRILLKKVKVVKSYGLSLLIKAHQEKLTTAFLNIIINAIEAVKERGKLWITAYRAKDEVKVIFKDNGSGISPDVAAHIFERNFSSKPKGAGMGLSNVKDILQRHRANISINSEPGTGTTVIISFKNCC